MYPQTLRWWEYLGAGGYSLSRSRGGIEVGVMVRVGAGLMVVGGLWLGLG